MPKSPVIPLAPPEYDQRQIEQILQVLRTYFYTLDLPDKWKNGELYITACPTEADHDAGLLDTTVWVDNCGFLRLEGAENELCTWYPPSGDDGAFDAGGFYPSRPSSSKMIMRLVFVRSVDFPADLVGSHGSAAVAATAQADFDIQKNDVSIGTMRFAAAATIPTFVGVSATSFVATDVLTVIAPSLPDTTLANIGWNFKGTKV